MTNSLASPVSVQVSVEKIYVKDLSLENPGAPQTFRLNEPPSVEICHWYRGAGRPVASTPNTTVPPAAVDRSFGCEAMAGAPAIAVQPTSMWLPSQSMLQFWSE